jgi:hypothetical protein
MKFTLLVYKKSVTLGGETLENRVDRDLYEENNSRSYYLKVVPSSTFQELNRVPQHNIEASFRSCTPERPTTSECLLSFVRS